MTPFEGFAGHQNKLFWGVFTVALLFLLASLFSRGLIEIALGLVLVAVGLHRLDLELKHRNQEDSRKKFENYLQNVGNWLNSNHSTNNDWASKYDLRLHNLDKKRASFEKKVEKEYRDLVRKFIETESKLNRLAKTLEKKV